MKFFGGGTLNPEYGGAFADFAWEDGKLRGDVRALFALRHRATELIGQRIGLPTGPCTDTDHLSDPFSTMEIASQVFSDDIYFHNPPTRTIPFDPDVVY